MTGLISLSVLGVVTLLAGVFNLRQYLASITIIGLSVIFAINLMDWNTGIRYYNDMMFVDNFALAFTEVLILLSLLLFLLTEYHLNGDYHNAGEFYSILIFTLLGAQVMVSYSNLIMLFIGIEILSISLYVMAGSSKKLLSSNEAALKYFLMGAFASGFLLLGIAFIYGACGSFHLQNIAKYISDHTGNVSNLCLIGVLLLMVGLAFKVAAAPFHFWAPDVYEGSPTLITAFMATIVKTAGIAAFLRLFYFSFENISIEWNTVLSGIAILTMTVGNLTALYQKNFKRLLAYSGISHAGYLLVGIVALSSASSNAVFYYTVAYSLASVTAFSILIMISFQQTENTFIDSFNGLGKRNPAMAFVMTIAMLSLAGIPPLAGFFGKYYIFILAIQSQYWVLAAVAVINSLIGIYYYFYIIIAMYLKEPVNEYSPKPALAGSIVLIITTALTILLGIFPDLLLQVI